MPAEIGLAELPVILETRDAEIDRAVLPVGVSFLFQPFDQRNHLRYVGGGARHQLGQLDAERPAVFEEGLRVLLGVVLQAHSLLTGVLDDPVVHIGDVHHVDDPEAAIREVAPQQVLENRMS